MPIRYTYSKIKKIIGGFKDKLGQGGYGSVFKGKLRSGHFVAIKLLGRAKSDGQDFINEVATMGRIHHANVMQLIGFCVEGSKQALEEGTQIHFLIHERFDQGEDIELGDVTDIEKNLVRKIVIVALWCIQMKPAIRPSMSKVLEMLESEVQLLEMPPKPSFVPSELQTANRVNINVNISQAAQPTMSLDART
ncbi:hypothetical protein SLEP1_g53643 [Rubroshorea leprosula]|uniref:Protein kinase domain-containing protein n=1 Tax=Rubroshorea leprosula TaxID=152421 RepID=A0AAV5MB43_9ROSI|nr:hypothetical protein SLEP1_g53643 [Rubroshorea leprosula]